MTDREHSAYVYLSRLWRIGREIRDKEEELRTIGLTQAVRYDRDAVQTSPSDPMEKVGDIIDEIREEQTRYVRLQHQLINQIHGLEDAVSEQILVDRFIHNKSMKWINGKYNYHKATGYRLFRKALDDFAVKYDTK